jgi:hypothetical protein
LKDEPLRKGNSHFWSSTLGEFTVQNDHWFEIDFFIINYEVLAIDQFLHFQLIDLRKLLQPLNKLRRFHKIFVALKEEVF